MLRFATILTAVSAFTGCASSGPVSTDNMVQFYQQDATILNDCTKLAPVQSRVNMASVITRGQAHDKAQRFLAEQAASYGGDSVVLLGTSDEIFYVHATGIAYRCFGS